HLHRPAEIHLALDVAADFADLFEVKDDKVAARDVTFAEDERTMVLGYRRDDFHRSLTIASTRAALVTRSGFRFDLILGPGEEWSTTFTVTPGEIDDADDERPWGATEMRRRAAAKA